MSALDSEGPRVVAFYLPHFYSGPALPGRLPAAAGDAGAWQQLASARALFPGHDQPRVPADLGYCDLRVPEVRLAQADLARAYGIDAFCYFHYWCAGRRQFERPFTEVLASGEPDFPFCLCWANESRADSGLSREEARADELAHAAVLAAAFADPRYLRVGGRPVFVVRRPRELADAAATLGAIREAAADLGVGDPLLLGSGGGFDAELDWPSLDREWDAPRGTALEPAPREFGNLLRLRRWLPRLAVQKERAARQRFAAPQAVADAAGSIPVVLSGWDDTPARGGSGTVLTDRDPELFHRDLLAALRRAESAPEPQRMVFLFAWNAWLQGAALEPDRRFGRAYLAAVARARIRFSPPDERARR
ncbi:MAG: glycoside hydrolase family 99-like domain-containing protein [Thermoanaerobaculia bacterium]